MSLESQSNEWAPIDRPESDQDAVRVEFLTGVEKCRASVLSAEQDLGLDAALRAALAQRIWRKTAPSFEGFPSDQDDGDLGRISKGDMPVDQKLAAIVAFTDLIAINPGQAGKINLKTLRNAGLTEPQIVALCELVGFVSLDVRISFGLSLVKDLT
ncbi:hypothetical protein [Falsihalocynthiibacter arcticus]|uniref:Carboxymuconolactone decarboxylase-like domain-containing protein n=1 Tax=Falsihalocynthiibacter arcticus TaxID=1579316 RepID=A0A126V0N2_9RHOB|nr:hypothetical protein [Falsihalocynthiibacter arcticus]AML51850.1 hypothetical protein RC74_11755 [Falsihalocynthiibacter arcticus]